MTRRETVGAVFLALLALALRIPGANGPLWFDEVQLLVELVRAPLSTVVGDFRSDNNHPLYSLLAWGAVRLFGEDPWVLRLPAIGFGVASVVLVFLLGIRIGWAREGFLAGLLLAVSDHHVWFSQNARGYTGLLAFALLATIAFLDSCSRPSRGAVLRHGLWLALGSFVHLTGVYVALAQLVVGLAVARRRPAGHGRFAPVLGVFVGGGFSLLLHAPMLVPMARFFLGWHGEGRVQAVWRSPLWMLDATRQSLGLDPAIFIAAVAGATAAGGIVFVLVARERPAIPWLFVLPPLLGFAVSLVLGRNLWPRFFFFATGFALLLGLRGAALVLAALPPRRPRVARLLLVLLVLPPLFFFATRLGRTWQVPKQDFAAARDWITGVRQPGDRVYTVGLAIQPYEWLYAPEFEAVRSVDELDAALRRSPRAIVVQTLPEFLRGQDPALFEALRTRFVEIRRFPGTVGDGDITVLRPRP